MTIAGTNRRTSENLLETYFALGAACPGARISQEPGYRLCLSSIDHPISNFAASLNLDANTAQRLAALAIHHPSFHVYLVPGDAPKHAGELLQCAGFRVTHLLDQMTWDPQFGTRGPYIELAEAVSPKARDAVAGFMAEQFFASQKGWFRRRVAESTSGANSLRLFSTSERHKVIAAVMICETEETLGVYNLCVAPPHRNRGWGAEIVGAVQAMAWRARKPIILQCETGLRGWYRELGLEPTGSVQVYGLASGSGAAIMH